MNFSVEAKIFEYFPGMRLVAAAAYGLHLPEDRGPVAADLDEAWAMAAAAASAYGNPQSHPNIKPWGERMKKAGAPRKDFPCSIEALTRRAGKGGRPLTIHPFVDFYNAVSLRHLVPAGGFDIDALREGLALRLSRPGDTFAALDGGESVAVPAGEVSYADGGVIITRHFVWKQSRHAIITPESKNIFFVSEILGELPPETAQNVCDSLSEGLVRFFRTEVRTDILDAGRRSMEIR